MELDVWAKIQKMIDAETLKKGSFSRKLGISRQTLDNWLKGETSPTAKDLDKMSKIMDNLGLNSTGNSESEEIYRNIVEGNTEYILIPRSVLQEKYRLVAVEQYERDKAQMEKDRAYLDGQFQTIQSLIAQIDKLNTKPPDIQKTQ